jgi:hypothetical protein
MAARNKTLELVAAVFCFACAFLQLSFVSCATVPEGPMGLRLLPVEKRYDFLQTSGTDTPVEVRNAFLEGMTVPGMPREWVLQLYGRPDRITDRSWEYFDGKGKAVLEIYFENDAVDSVHTITRAP